MTIKIGILTLHLHLGFGVDLVVDRSARELIRYGYKPIVYTLSREMLYRETPYAVSLLNDAHLAEYQPFDYRFLKHAEAYLKTQNCALWIIHSPPFDRRMLSLPAPIIYWEHGTPPGSFFDPIHGDLLDWTTWYRQNRVYTNASETTRVVAISEFIRRSLPPHIYPRTTVIYNGVDHQPRCSESEAMEMRMSLGINDDEYMLFSLTRIELESTLQPYKGVSEIVSLWESWRARNARIRLVLAGRCSDETVQHLKQHGIIVLPNIDSERLPALYKAADLYVTATQWEGFDLPMCEAQFQGTPVVGYAIGAHNEIVKHGITGYLATSSDEFSATVVTLLEARDKRREMGNHAKEFMKQFTWHQHGELIHNLINEALNTSANKTQNRSAVVTKIYDLFNHMNFLYKIEVICWFIRNGKLRSLSKLLLHSIMRRGKGA